MSTVQGLPQPNTSKLKYIEWFSNPVLVKKASSKWWMCVDYNNLNQACYKDPYMFLNINKMEDNSPWYKLVSLLDTYSG